MEHPQAALLRAIADGKQMQQQSQENEQWFDVKANQAMYAISQVWKVRIKPDTLLINGMEVPKPSCNAMSLHSVTIGMATSRTNTTWNSTHFHDTYEAARRHFDVLVAASKGETL